MAWIYDQNPQKTLRDWLTSSVNLLFPPRCAGCGNSKTDWCTSCDNGIDRITKPFCLRCGRPHSRIIRNCNSCFEYPEKLKIRSFAKYKGPLLRALLQLKYRPNQRLSAVMGHWLAELLQSANWNPTLIAAVPLSKKRLRARGYNQSALIAKELSVIMDLHYDEHGISRTRETKSQVGLDPVARWNNVRKAFQADPIQVDGHRVILVDDLITTGATLSACAEALDEAGARIIYGLTVARA